MCDEVRKKLVRIHGQYRAMFSALFKMIAPEISITTYRVYAGEYPDLVDAHDA